MALLCVPSGVRIEMALKLADDSGWGRQVQRVGVTLPTVYLSH